MSPDYFQIAVSIAGLVLGLVNAWVLFAVNSFRNEITALRLADTGLAGQMSELKTLLAGNYVLREDFRTDMREQTSTLTDAMTRMEIRLMERIRGGTV